MHGIKSRDTSKYCMSHRAVDPTFVRKQTILHLLPPSPSHQSSRNTEFAPQKDFFSQLFPSKLLNRQNQLVHLPYHIHQPLLGTHIFTVYLILEWAHSPLRLLGVASCCVDPCSGDQKTDDWRREANLQQTRLAKLTGGSKAVGDVQRDVITTRQEEPNTTMQRVNWSSLQVTVINWREQIPHDTIGTSRHPYTCCYWTV